MKDLISLVMFILGGAGIAFLLFSGIPLLMDVLYRRWEVEWVWPVVGGALGVYLWTVYKSW